THLQNQNNPTVLENQEFSTPMPTRSTEKNQRGKKVKIPPGTGLLLVGSGLYWVLASPLIGWFSVLDSGQVHLSQLGITMVLVTGIACLVLGLWIISTDFE